MGFMDKLGKIAGNAVNNGIEKYERYSERCQDWDDDTLIRKAKSSSNLAEKMAYVRELQNRGYSAEDFR